LHGPNVLHDYDNILTFWIQSSTLSFFTTRFFFASVSYFRVDTYSGMFTEPYTEHCAPSLAYCSWQTIAEAEAHRSTSQLRR
jgi:hypothetical protein